MWTHCQNQMCAVSSKEKACLCDWHLKSNCREVKRMEEPFIAVNNASNFAAEVQRKLEQNPKNRKMYILIVPPDKSSLILQDQENISFVDSHSHKSKGALKIVGSTSYPMQFCQFIEVIITRDWKTKLEFANLSQLKLVVT